MTNTDIAGDLLFLSANQIQAADNMRLLLDGLEREGSTITQGQVAAELFAERLRMYLGALHFIADSLEADSKTLAGLG